MTQKKVIVKGIEVRYNRIAEEDYICITDIAKAKNAEHSGLVISHWMRNNSTIQYLGLWETLNNPNFNVTEFGNI
ncbi:MAG: KilA-N domain-containing protein, partial [Firmicutes bacterium]|nr:KilA-N domain-containing protein [Bacillota bacterium]